MLKPSGGACRAPETAPTFETEYFGVEVLVIPVRASSGHNKKKNNNNNKEKRRTRTNENENKKKA